MSYTDQSPVHRDIHRVAAAAPASGGSAVSLASSTTWNGRTVTTASTTRPALSAVQSHILDAVDDMPYELVTIMENYSLEDMHRIIECAQGDLTLFSPRIQQELLTQICTEPSTFDFSQYVKILELLLLKQERNKDLLLVILDQVSPETESGQRSATLLIQATGAQFLTLVQAFDLLDCRSIYQFAAENYSQGKDLELPNKLFYGLGMALQSPGRLDTYSVSELISLKAVIEKFELPMFQPDALRAIEQQVMTKLSGSYALPTVEELSAIICPTAWVPGGLSQMRREAINALLDNPDKLSSCTDEEILRFAGYSWPLHEEEDALLVKCLLNALSQLLDLRGVPDLTNVYNPHLIAILHNFDRVQVSNPHLFKAIAAELLRDDASKLHPVNELDRILVCYVQAGVIHEELFKAIEARCFGGCFVWSAGSISTLHNIRDLFKSVKVGSPRLFEAVDRETDRIRALAHA